MSGWRGCCGVSRLDEEVFDVLLSAELAGVIPVLVTHGLPDGSEIAFYLVLLVFGEALPAAFS